MQCVCSAMALATQLEELKKLEELKGVLPISEDEIKFRKDLAKASADDVAKECNIDVEVIKRGIDAGLYEDALVELLEQLKCPVWRG